MTIYSGFSHEKWWFSIVTLNYIKLPEGNLHILQHRKICTKTIPNWDFQPSKGQIPRPQPPSQPQKKLPPNSSPQCPRCPRCPRCLRPAPHSSSLPRHTWDFGPFRLIGLILDQLGSWRPAATNKNSLVSGFNASCHWDPISPRRMWWDNKPLGFSVTQMVFSGISMAKHQLHSQASARRHHAILWKCLITQSGCWE